MSFRVLNSLLGSYQASYHNRLLSWATVSDVVSQQQFNFKTKATCLYKGTRTLTSFSVLPSTNKPSSSPIFDHQRPLLFNNAANDHLCLFLTQQRGAKKKAGGKGGKSKKGEKTAAVEEEDEDEDNDKDEEDSDVDDDSSDNDVKVFNTTVISLRLDAIGKTCFNIPRAKIEESFYNDLIRVNGERVAKKSYEIRIDDVIDYIKGLNTDDRSKLDITRVQILSVDDKAASSGRIRISFRKTNGLTVDNYTRDPYEGAL